MRNPRRHPHPDDAHHAAATPGPVASMPHELTIVIKLGTSSIVSESTLMPQLALLSAIAEAACTLKKLGHRVLLVSSGAIGMGLKRMEMGKKPKALAEKQALAAIGQGRLIALWDNLFSLLGQPIAQVLLTRNDISDRSRYLNSTNTLRALLSYGVIPIVNENDTVSVSEIKFGDNDTLSAITAAMIQADYLFLFTDVDCLYTENPRRFPDTAKPVRIVRDIESVREVVSTATLGSSIGTGGMETKLIAAELATGAGVSTVITHGARPSAILDIVSQPPGIPDQEYIANTPLHTVFLPKESPLSDRKWWVLHGLKPRGRVIIDEGAYRAIARSSSSAKRPSMSSSNSSSAAMDPIAITPISSTPVRASSSPHSHSTPPSSTSTSGNGGRLLPAGVLAVEGTFAAGQAVTIVVRKPRRSTTQSKPSRANGETSLQGTQLPDDSTDEAHRDQGQSSASIDPLANSTASIDSVSYPASTPEQSRPGSPHHLSHSVSELVTTAIGDAPRHSSDHARAGTSPDEGQRWEEIEFGRGLANYNSLEIEKIKGHKSSEIEKILGYIEAEHCVESITSLKRLEL